MSSASPHQPSGTLAIIAALPRELKMLSRDLGAVRVVDKDGILVEAGRLAANSSFVLVTAGMGAERVSLAVAAALAHGPVDTLLSVGLAGACDPLLLPGGVIEASLVIDSRSGERFGTAAGLGIAAPGVLVTSPRIAGVAEKQRLFGTYAAAAVDMEAAAVGRLARAHGCAFRAIKAISDEHDVDLSALSSFSDARGQFRTAAFALHTLVRPHLWRSTAVLGRTSSSALECLTSALHQVIVARAATL